MGSSTVTFLHPAPLPCHRGFGRHSPGKCPHNVRQPRHSAPTSELDPGVSRRTFLSLTSASIIASLLPIRSASAQKPRTVFDEEVQLFNEKKEEAEEARRNALRASFEAVEKASVQLDDLEKLIQNEEWDETRRFTRLFNNAVEREGMESISRKLESKEDRDEGLKKSKRVTDLLRKVDIYGKKEDKEGALKYVAEVRVAVHDFQKLKPAVQGAAVSGE